MKIVESKFPKQAQDRQREWPNSFSRIEDSPRLLERESYSPLSYHKESTKAILFCQVYGGGDSPHAAFLASFLLTKVGSCCIKKCPIVLNKTGL
jgi:hypothetical protein